MGYKDITAGNKNGRLKAARFVTSKNGTMAIECAFEFEEPSTGMIETLNWQGWLTPKALPYTMDTLVDVLGFNDIQDSQGNTNLNDMRAFDWKREVRLVVELEEHEGKSYPKIKYVNKLNASQYRGVEPKQITADLDALGFRAAFLKAKAKAEQSTVDEENAADLDKVPF